MLAGRKGHFAGRLARGRKIGAAGNRGVVLSAGSLATVISQNVASAGVPIALMSSTVKAATMIVAGQATVAGVVPAKAVALMEGVMKAMLMTKLKTVTAVVLVVTAVGMGGGLLSRSTTAAAQTADERVPKGYNQPPSATCPAQQDAGSDKGRHYQDGLGPASRSLVRRLDRTGRQARQAGEGRLHG